MTTYTIPTTADRIERLGDDGPRAVTDYLTAHDPPYDVGGVSLRLRPEPAIVIEADRDPTADLAGWTPPPSSDEKALARLESYLQIYRDGGTPTPAQVARAVKALAAVWLRSPDDMD